MDPFLYCQLYLFISQFAPQFFEKEQHAANQALTHVAVGSPVEHTSFLPSTFEFSGAAEYDYVYGISQERPSSCKSSPLLTNSSSASETDTLQSDAI